MSAEDKKSLVACFLKFLSDELANGNISDDNAESLEVAAQCLETVYGVSLESVRNEKSFPSLLELFSDLEAQVAESKSFLAPQPQNFPEATDDEKKEAEALKLQGNDCVRAEKYEEAVSFYTAAIAKHPSNPVLYCNRGAAQSKLERHEEALSDCQIAISIDPSYGKAYGRMGIAFSSLNQHKDAIECYKKALECDADNETFKSNLKIAQERLAEINLPDASQTRPAASAGLSGGLPDFSAFLGNPQLMSMASQMMSSPEMLSNMQQMMGSFANSGAAGGEQGGLSGLMQVGQQLASVMQRSNPELVEQLRSQMEPIHQNAPEPNKED